MEKRRDRVFSYAVVSIAINQVPFVLIAALLLLLSLFTNLVSVIASSSDRPFCVQSRSTAINIMQVFRQKLQIRFFMSVPK